MLRKDKVIEKELSLYDQDSVTEMGHLSLVFKLKIEEFEDQVYEDVREIEKHYYDPFNDNPYEIQKNLSKIQDNVKKKHQIMEDKYAQQYKRNNAMRQLAVDLAYLRKNYQDLSNENEKMSKRITQIQNVDEIHIEIDVLAQSEQGINALKEKYAKLKARFDYEKLRYQALEKEYFKIEPNLKQIQTLKNQINEVKDAGDQQDFHLDRYKDLLNRIKMQKETIISQEEIIQNLAHSVKEQNKTQSVQENSEVEILLSDLKYKRERLKERLKQLKILTKMNDGQLPNDYISKIKDEEIQENKEEYDRMRAYEDELLNMIQETTKQLDIHAPLKQNYYRTQSNFNDQNRGQWEQEKEYIQIQVRGLESRSFNLEKELQQKTQIHAKQVADLKYQIVMAQAEIDEKAALQY